MDTVIAGYTVIILYCVLAITGLIGNIWVMMTVIGQFVGCTAPPFNRRRGTVPAGVQFSACFYLLLLSVVDLVSFVPVPLLAADILENAWPFGLPLCKLLYSCEGANKSLSPLVLTALSVDRYIAVCKPSFVWLRQTAFALMVILFCIFISSLFILPVTLRATISVMVDNNQREHTKCTVAMTRTYDVLHTVTCYVLPLCLICSVYIAILRRLYRHTRTSTVGRRTSISLSRVVKCSVLVVAFYFICWTPYWAMRIYSILSFVPDGFPGFEDLSAPPSIPISSPLTSNSAPSSVNHSKTLLFLLADNLTATVNSAQQTYRNLSATDLSLLTLLLNKRITEENGSGFGTSKVSMEPAEEEGSPLQDYRHILLMYMVHALPYTQSAFNWLFYAFLNRNLRQSARCPLSTRSQGATATPVDVGNGHTSNGTSGGGGAAIWKNIQFMGNYLKSAGWETRESVLRRSPFRSSKSRIRSRSTTYLDTTSNGVIISTASSPNGHVDSANYITGSRPSTFFTTASMTEMGLPSSVKRTGSPLLSHIGQRSRLSWPSGTYNGATHLAADFGPHLNAGSGPHLSPSENGASLNLEKENSLLLINMPSSPSSFNSKISFRSSGIEGAVVEEDEEQIERESLDVPLISETDREDKETRPKFTLEANPANIPAAQKEKTPSPDGSGKCSESSEVEWL
ncbi:7 transmembrane receptor (rhodopsin family) domain-containing protein [Ditylenchus destructor]|nr:7 transmembrane receptor (rhodopsin family) domain-containing protein [Ditylenchus destructor]